VEDPEGRRRARIYRRAEGGEVGGAKGSPVRRSSAEQPARDLSLFTIVYVFKSMEVLFFLTYFND